MNKRIINDSIHNWVNNNRELLAPYKGQWVAHNANEVVANAPTGSALVQSIKEKKITNYTIVFVHPTWFAKPVRFLPIRFKTLKKHEWTPNYEVTIAGAAQSQTVEMLIDSGADMCLIPKWLGESLGLAVSMGEIMQEAFGIGGSVKYVMRNLTYTINSTTITEVPTAWVQTDEVSDIIIGREVIFDAFDVEFKQADEMIVFKKREVITNKINH
jgi:hypothetical protein